MRWSHVAVFATILALLCGSGCLDFSGDLVSDGFDGFSEGFADRVVAQRRLKVNLDDLNPTQRFLFSVDVRPFGGGTIDVTVLEADQSQLQGDLNPASFADGDPRSWFSFGPGIPLQSFLVESGDNFVLGLGTFTPPMAATLQLSVTAPPDVDFDGDLDGVVGTIGDLRPIR